MTPKNLFLVFFVFLSLTSFSQKKKDVLLTINEKPVYTSEFVRVFKKNLDLVQDDSQKSVDGYLDLFIDYKLKVAEAYAQGLDTTKSYKREFLKYRDQLARNYIYENAITEDIAKEAYERGLEQVNADHILVKIGYEALPKDTLTAYNKIKSIRDKALAGEDFTELAKKYSEEPGAKERGGKLGWFSVFQMVYPFETAAYNTNVGEISKITRTSFGYHIIKINDRRKKGNDITVSHIMIAPKKKDSTFDPKERINELYAMLQQGESFESLAKQFSDDKASGKNGGKLRPFGKGQLRAPKFEEAAFKLQKEGEISAPIESKFGWHIIRLEKINPIKSFEEQKAELEKQVSKGERSKKITNTVAHRIKEKYGFTKNKAYMPFFTTYVSDSILNHTWEYTPIAQQANKTLFAIGNKTVTYDDFANYIAENQKRTRRLKTKEAKIKELYDEFEIQTVKEYFKQELEKENPEYAAVLDEYRSGLLIFDVMEKNVWNKAKTDSLGLEAFYQENKQNYLWKTRIDGAIFTATNQAIAKQVKELLTKGKSIEQIKKTINKDDTVSVIVTEGVFELGQPELPKEVEVKNGVSTIYKKEDSFVVLLVKEVLYPSVKPLEDVRGKVISDYQNYLEKQWISDLHKKYKIEINKKVLKKLKKQLKK